MGVYIDMEMPKKTYAHCMLIKDIDGSVQLHVCTKNSEEISEWEFYDLVHVPEPHGRLGDLDALHNAIAANIIGSRCGEETSVEIAINETIFDDLMVIDAQQTIIPSSEEASA